MPKVSVIIPVFNAEKYLKECLDSALNQTIDDIEIICIDDGSIDKSGKICDEYTEKDNRVKVIHQKNSGAAIARNKGIEIASGEYLAFLDSDDFYEPNMLEKLYTKAIESDAEVVSCDCFNFDNLTKKNINIDGCIKKRYLSEKAIFNAKEIHKYIFNYTAGYAWNKLFKTSLIKDNNIKFHNDLKIFEDAPFTFLALLLANKQCVIYEKLIHHRAFLRSSLYLQVTRRPEDSTKAIYILKEILEHLNCYELYEQSLINLAAAFIFDAIGMMNKKFNIPKKKAFCNILKNKFFKDFNIIQRERSYFYENDHYDRIHMIDNITYYYLRKLENLKLLFIMENL